MHPVGQQTAHLQGQHESQALEEALDLLQRFADLEWHHGQPRRLQTHQDRVALGDPPDTDILINFNTRISSGCMTSHQCRPVTFLYYVQNPFLTPPPKGKKIINLKN